MSSDAVATAAREHAQADEVAHDVRGDSEVANPAAPFAAGAKRLAAMHPAQVVALQRLAGNSAVSGLLTRRSASVQRVGPAEGAGAPAGKSDWKHLRPEGDDPMVVVNDIGLIFRMTDTIVPDAKFRGDPKVFHPTLGAIMFRDFIVILDRDANPMDIRPQTDPPQMVRPANVAIHEAASTAMWLLFLDQNGKLLVNLRHEQMTPIEGAKPGLGRLLVFAPDLYLGADNAADLRKRIPGGPKAKPGQPPDWAKDQARKLEKRRGKSADATPGGPGGVEGGKGLGNEDKGGTGGGGLTDDPKAVPGGDGQPKAKDGAPGGPPRDPKAPPLPKKGSGSGSGAAPTPGAKPTPGGRKPGGTGKPGDADTPPPPLQGVPKFKVVATGDGTPRLLITLDRAATSIELREGERDGVLDGRIDKAIKDLQDSRDPAKHGTVVHAATETGFKAPAKGQPGTAGSGADAASQARSTPTGVTPGERAPGARGGANAPAYPARISMGGSQEAAPVTVSGATNPFTMELDYAAMSFGMQDEVFNRMQLITFYWELLDVTGKTILEKKEVEKTAKVGSGAVITPGQGDKRNIGRTLENVAEDQEKDLAMMEREGWGWESRAAYLAVIGLSNSVRMIGSVVESFFAAVTRPLNERPIGFEHLGEYLVRCVATPQPSDKALEDPDNHVIRASSIAAMPIRVMDINARARDSISEEDRQLAKLEQAVKDATDDKARQVAQMKLDAARKATSQAGQAAYQSSMAGIRDQLATARLLKTHMDAHVKDRDLSAPEIYLEAALEERGATVEQMIAQLERQLKTMGGDDADKGVGRGEHEKWVAGQAGTFKGGVEYRPRVVLASEETGQVTPVLTMLGEAKDSTDDHPKWRLIDISSPSSRDIYEGESATAGSAGHGAAIRDAFRNLAENNEYGRGTIAIRLPAQLLSEPGYAGITIDPLMRSAKGGKGRFLQRLQDLATVAEVVGLFVTGPIGVALGAVGGIAGAIVAVDSLAKRARTGHVWEVSTIFDVLGVIGGVTSVAGVGVAVGRARLDKLAGAGQKVPGWVSKLEKTEKALHIHGVVGNIQQIFVIPYQLIEELNGIEGGTEGERDARRALAFMRAIRSGTVTVIGAMGGIPVGEGKAGKAPSEPEPAGRRPLPAGHGADAAEAHAGGSGPARPPTQAPVDAAGSGGQQPHTGGEPQTGGPGSKPAGGGDPAADVRTPTPDQILAKAHELARQRARESAEIVSGTEPGTPKPATPADPVGPKPAAGGTDTGTPKPATPGTETGIPKAAKPADPAGTKPPTPHGDGATGNEPLGPDVARREALIGIVGKSGTAPDKASQEVRPGATKNGASADPDAVTTVKDAGQFGQVRRDVESMNNLNDGQRSALKSRLQEARLAVTNEHVGKVLADVQQRFPDLDFHVQDLGTVGFNSDRDITIRVTPKDAAAYAKLSPDEQAHMDRRLVLASAEAVPELYKALDAAGYPADRSLDTNFYTELHEGRVRPSGAEEATQIASDQQIVSMTEILLNTSPEQWQAFVDQQRGMIEGLRAQKTPEADIVSLRKRLDAQVAEAESHAKHLVGESGKPTPDRRNAALAKARDDLAAALKRQPPPSARETRQLMADVKLLEPDAFGTRGAVEGVVLGGQAMTGATLDKVQKDGFRTRRQIEHSEGEVGPRRLDATSGELREVSAEDEVGRRRAEASPNVGHRRPGDANLSAYELNVKRLAVAQAVTAHLLGHLPEPSAARPTDTSTAAKNLGRIVTAASEAGITGGSDGLKHLPAIVAAKGAADSIGAIHKELAGWAREGGVRGWAESKGYPLRTDAERVAAFIGWSKEQAMNLTGRLRIRTETGAVHGDVAVGTGRSTPPATGAPAAATTQGSSPDDG